MDLYEFVPGSVAVFRSLIETVLLGTFFSVVPWGMTVKLYRRQPVTRS